MVKLNPNSLCKLRIELLILIPTPLKGWGYTCVSLCLVCVVLKIELRVSCILDKLATKSQPYTVFWAS